MSPKNTPMMNANAIASTPTLISEMQLTMIAMAKATTDKTGSDMVGGFYQRTRGKFGVRPVNTLFSQKKGIDRSDPEFPLEDVLQRKLHDSRVESRTNLAKGVVQVGRI